AAHTAPVKAPDNPPQVTMLVSRRTRLAPNRRPTDYVERSAQREPLAGLNCHRRRKMFLRHMRKSHLPSNKLYSEDDRWLLVAHENPPSCNPLWPRAARCDQIGLPLWAYVAGSPPAVNIYFAKTLYLLS